MTPLTDFERLMVARVIIAVADPDKAWLIERTLKPQTKAESDAFKRAARKMQD